MAVGWRLSGWIWLVAAVLTVSWSGPSAAHDIPNARIERATQVYLSAGELLIDYEVALAELTLVQDLRQLDGESSGGDRAALFDRYARVVGPLNARGFLITVDGTTIDLQVTGFAIAVADHPQFRFQFRAPVPTRGRLVVVDTNYSSSEGSARLALAAAKGIALGGDIPPARVESIPLVPTWQLTDAEERRGRRLDITYTPRVEGIRSIPPPGGSEASGSVPPPALRSPAAWAVGGLSNLLDLRGPGTSLGWLVLAFVLGMVHAVQPGHGKTLVTAAILGRAASGSRRGIRLGLVTALFHLGSVVALAALLWVSTSTHFGSIHRTMARLSGFMIAAVGAFRVGRQVAGIAPTEAHDRRLDSGIWSLGLAAGFLPCWDAVSLVVLAAATDQLGRGLLLLVAFSAGLGVVLSGVGWAAGRVQRRAVDSTRAAGLIRGLQLGSGLVLAAVGLGLLGS